ncbi:MAG: nickel-dependent hydrogenase large subunit [Desulfovibrionales bacterium]
MATVIPFGPQHPVLPEPIHLKLVVEDEVVQQAVPALGFVHRGLESLVDVRDFHQMVQVTERVCGICSMIHAAVYCQCIEELMGVEIPPRGAMLRVVWSELHRLHSHLLWLGLAADAFGFEALFMQSMRIREIIMDVMEKTAGNRVIISVNVVGGVRRDLDSEQQKWILAQLDRVQTGLQRISSAFLNEYTVQQRSKGIGALNRDKALELGAVGPTLRGSGVAQDIRMLGYGGYSELEFEPVVEQGGDSYSRMKVRLWEAFQSIALVRQALGKLPEGEIAVKVKGRPEGEVIQRVEQPRGELLYYVRGSGKKNLDRLRIRTPTNANIAPLLAMIPGCELADVPVIVLSIDPCISCTER